MGNCGKRGLILTRSADEERNDFLPATTQGGSFDAARVLRVCAVQRETFGLCQTCISLFSFGVVTHRSTNVN